MMGSTTKAASFLPTSGQIGILLGIVLMFIWEVLKHYTHWDWRVCLLVAAFPVWVAQRLLFKTSLKEWAIQVLASVASCFIAWELVNLLWK